ncbi:hypothetical protein ACQ33O_03750 [Ferruginibacter sp. SUN002]|uniref:hypothetical protein n=1 Tax=Ferruginibacter sp. SUN002 TaxID=2937789 RepID=UPI003D35D6B9
MKNESTVNKSLLHSADRILDAALLTFDLQAIIAKLKQEDIWKMGERDSVTLMKSEYMRIVLIALHSQMEINFHQSGNVISIQLIEGEVIFETEAQSVILKEGSLLTLHEEMTHTLTAVKESVFLLTVALCSA